MLEEKQDEGKMKALLKKKQGVFVDGKGDLVLGALDDDRTKSEIFEAELENKQQLEFTT